MFSGWGVPPRVGSVRPPGWRGVVSAFGVLMRFIIFSSLCVFFFVLWGMRRQRLSGGDRNPNVAGLVLWSNRERQEARFCI